MNTWVFEEYFGLPALLIKMRRENQKNITGISREKLQYGKDVHQYILLMKPEKRAVLKSNTIYFIHGGGWAVGSAAFFAFVGSFFAGLGYNVILGGYRHAPKHKYPAQLEDVCIGLAAGLKALKEQGEEAGGVIVAGQSAGAQLAGLLVLDIKNTVRLGIDPAVFSAMILISGPMDFSSCNARQIRLGLHGFLDSKTDYAEADPIRLIKENFSCPVLCIHGNKDPIVDVRNSINFYKRIKEAGSEGSKLVIAEGRHHFELLEMFYKNTETTKSLKKYVYEIEKM